MNDRFKRLLALVAIASAGVAVYLLVAGMTRPQLQSSWRGKKRSREFVSRQAREKQDVFGFLGRRIEAYRDSHGQYPETLYALGLTELPHGVSTAFLDNVAYSCHNIQSNSVGSSRGYSLTDRKGWPKLKAELIKAGRKELLPEGEGGQQPRG